MSMMKNHMRTLHARNSSVSADYPLVDLALVLALPVMTMAMAIAAPSHPVSLKPS